MIIDNGSKSPVDDSTPLLGDASAPNAPPAYTPPPRGDPTPMGNTQIPYAVYEPVYTQLEQGQQSQQLTEEPAGRRFCKAFLVALGIWALFTFFANLTFAYLAVQSVGYPIPSGLKLPVCATTWHEKSNPEPFSAFPYAATASFDLNLPSRTLLLLSKGGLSNGHLKITSSPDVRTVRVNVTINYWIPAVRDAAKVCFIEGSEGEGGVGIFTPQPWRVRTYADRLFFDVELIFPRSDSILRVNGLSTDVNNFSHEVDALDSYFNDLSLTGSNGKIQAKSLTAAQATLTTSNAAVAVDNLVAPKASIQSSNGPITGTYAIADSLTLKTSNGAIDVAASITGNSSLEKPQDITMQTSNGPLNYIVDLGRTAGEAGSFSVKADTSNGKITGKIVSAPLNSILGTHARTSNHLVSLALPSTYEGSLSISSNSAPTVSRDTQQKHPACGSDANCNGPKRIFYLTKVTKSIFEGAICWDSQNADLGSVFLSSSNGVAALYL
ncbi:hypothetical protein MSAN_01654600 [Mycena sanguinolenta]|uniref:DUF7330 domain-containing protein n=1 Tax=Mycena sanguinolenta TaxID=230812 RepID=A0A8H6XYZ8_9AGAR|nr:hypothetical protein MSAN_01654600 [Mycena sanguinolenta]